MYKLVVENTKGERLDLTADKDLVLGEEDGFYGFTNNVSINQVANKDGGLYADSYTNVRNIQLPFYLQNEPELQRFKLYKYFPRKGQIKLWYTTKQRKVFINGYVEDVTINVHTNPVEALVIIVCPDPYFKTQDEELVYFNERIPLLTFPLSTNLDEPIKFSEVQNLTEQNLYNRGEVENGVTITFKATGGVVVNPKIENTSTNEFIGLNYEMQEGDTIIINTRFGNKTATLIRNGIEYNVLNYLMDDITWLVITLGDNIFYKSATSGDQNLTVQFTYNPQYNGV